MFPKSYKCMSLIFVCFKKYLLGYIKPFLVNVLWKIIVPVSHGSYGNITGICRDEILLNCPPASYNYPKYLTLSTLSNYHELFHSLF